MLAEEFRECRMVEVGVDQGGSTSFFTKLLSPHKMIALELSGKPVRTVTDFLSEHDPDGRVEIHWGVDQSDRVVVPDIIDRAFGGQTLDLVVDDASHLLAPSTATFEMLFPRYKTTERMLSHRYNTLVENKLHLDELDEQHTGLEQQIRMFVQLDKKRPRVLSFGPDLEQMYNMYKDKFNLGELDKDNIHTFISEMRDKCVWNEEKWDQFHHPLHYITFDPGDIWFFNAQWITHQIVFGTKLQCFEADILNESLLKPELCMAERIKKF